MKHYISRASSVDGERKKPTDSEVKEDDENYCKELLFYAHVLPLRSAKPLYNLVASEYLQHRMFAIRSHRICSHFIFLSLGSKGNYKFSVAMRSRAILEPYNAENDRNQRNASTL